MGLVTRRSDKLDDLFNKFASDPLKPVKKPDEQPKDAKEDAAKKKVPPSKSGWEITYSAGRMTKLGRTVGAVRTVLRPA